MRSLKKSRKVIIAFLLLLVIVIITTRIAGSKETKSALKQLSLGEKYLSELEYEKAVIAFHKVIEIEPKNLTAYIGLSEAYLGLKKKDNAVMTLQKGITLVEEEYESGGTLLDGSIDLYINLSKIYEDLGEIIKAYDILNRGFSLIGSEELKELLDTYAPKVEVSVPDGTYPMPQMISFINNEEGRIYYTLDGSEPTKESAIYSAPIHIEKGSVTLKVLAESKFGIMGEVQSFHYNIQPDENDTEGIWEAAPTPVINEPDNENSSIKEIKDITFTVEASSILQETIGGKTTIFNPLYISDKDEATAWVEASSEDGIGEWISFRSEEKFNLDSLQIINGYSKSEKTYLNNNRIAELKLISSEGEEKIINLKDNTRAYQDFLIDFKNISSVKIVITKIYKGVKYKDLCISELKFNKNLLNLMLSDSNTQMMKDMEGGNHALDIEKDLIGYYAIDYGEGGFYDANFELVDKFNTYYYPFQVAHNFALQEKGIVTRNEGAEDYEIGTWSVEGDKVIVIYDYGGEEELIIKNGMLFGEFSKEYKDINYPDYPFSSDDIVYEGYSKLN